MASRGRQLLQQCSSAAASTTTLRPLAIRCRTMRAAGASLSRRRWLKLKVRAGTRWAEATLCSECDEQRLGRGVTSWAGKRAERGRRRARCPLSRSSPNGGISTRSSRSSSFSVRYCSSDVSGHCLQLQLPFYSP